MVENTRTVRKKRGGDRTAQAVARQLQAMGCDRYEIGIRDAASGKMMNRLWAPEEIRERLAWLKRMNAVGNDVYIRPAEARHALILVDDLDIDDLDAMRQDGLEPALIVETSPKNFQVWLKLPSPCPPEIRGLIARRLAREYDADVASADARHYGRLAGFTNRKPVHTRADGLQPWVLCRESSGRVATKGALLVRWAEQELEKRRQQEQARRSKIATPAPPSPRRRDADAVAAYRREMARAVAQFGEAPDWSRCDFIVALRMSACGWSPDEIAEAMRQASPNLAQRKRGHVEDYVNRTVRKAVEAARSRSRMNREDQREDQGQDGPSLGM